VDVPSLSVPEGSMGEPVHLVCAPRSLNRALVDLILKLTLIYDRQSVGQSVLVSGVHLGPTTKFFFLLGIFFRQLRVCYLVAPTLTRGRFCNLLYNYFWTLTEQSYLIVSSETPPTWRARSPYLYPPGTGWPSYTPGHWVHLLPPLTIRRATVEVFYPASTRV
jgi:hypothetical protein